MAAQPQITREKEQQQTKTAGHRPNAALLRMAGLGVVVAMLVLLSVNAQMVLSQTLPPPQDSTYYYVGCFTARTDLLKESIYAKMPQSCVEICEHQTYSYAILSAERCFCANSFNRAERQDELLCNTRCLTNKAQYCGGVGVHSYYSTRLAKEPAAPNHLKLVNITEHSLTLTWEAYEPRPMFVGIGAVAEVPPAQQITNFLIKSHVVQTYSSQAALFAQPEFIVQSTETHFEITDLHPATEYNVSVEAMCASTVCGSASLRGTTEVGEPAPEPRQPRVLASTADTITIEIPPIRNDNGPVTQLLIIVERVDAALSQPFDTELLGSWQRAQDDGVPYYIAAELDYLPEQSANGRSLKFIVGNDKRYGRFTNPPLDKEAHVHVSLGVVSSLNGVTKTLYTHSTHDQHTISMDNFSYATFDSGRESLIALTVTCIIFGTCLVLSLITYFYLRYKTCQVRSGGNRLRNTHEMSIQQPIIERENNGYVVEDELPPAENFKQQLNALLNGLDATRRLPRNALRMNINEVIAEGRYGEVITGKVISSSALPEAAANNADCQLHVLALDDLSNSDQAYLLRDFRNLTQLQRHEHILDFYGVSASADWFYFVFEHQTVSLKRRLIESRRAPNSAPVQRITALSEELVLQWIYEVASALEYLSRCKVVHKQLCSHSIFVTAETKLKVAVFGPTPYAAGANNQKNVDLSRWLSPEALRYQHFSTKSDVWSFACVAWECCALGGTPYASITNAQQHLLDAIKSGSRPAQPAYVYQDLYQLLLNCWQLEPSDRINFEDIAFNVRQLMTSPRHALCFDRLPETPGNNVVDTLPYYLPMLEMQN